MSEFDRDILKAIEGFSRKSLQDLSGILAAVDARQRVVLNHDELASGLARLIEAGKIAAAGNYRYYSPKSPPSKRRFSGVPADEYDRACKAFQAMFAAAIEELEARPPSPDDKTRQKIVVRWNLGLAFPTNSDDDAIEPLIEMISRTLGADGRDWVSRHCCVASHRSLLIEIRAARGSPSNRTRPCPRRCSIEGDLPSPEAGMCGPQHKRPGFLTACDHAEQPPGLPC